MRASSVSPRIHGEEKCFDVDTLSRLWVLFHRSADQKAPEQRVGVYPTPELLHTQAEKIKQENERRRTTVERGRGTDRTDPLASTGEGARGSATRRSEREGTAHRHRSVVPFKFERVVECKGGAEMEWVAATAFIFSTAALSVAFFLWRRVRRLERQPTRKVPFSGSVGEGSFRFGRAQPWSDARGA